jgi:catechol 2,3-dioxygenase-like lactoylglutathione lyase family enzyme
MAASLAGREHDASVTRIERQQNPGQADRGFAPEDSMARIRHLAILTEDVDRMVKFYTNAFGLKIVQGVGTATYLTDGHINLAIIPIGPERLIEGNQLREGINHFGFEVDSVADLVPRCQEWGAATDTKKRPPNREAEYRVHDPDGNPIDLSQHGWPH